MSSHIAFRPGCFVRSRCSSSKHMWKIRASSRFSRTCACPVAGGNRCIRVEYCLSSTITEQKSCNETTASHACYGALENKIGWFSTVHNREMKRREHLSEVMRQLAIGRFDITKMICDARLSSRQPSLHGRIPRSLFRLPQSAQSGQIIRFSNKALCLPFIDHGCGKRITNHVGGGAPHIQKGVDAED